MDQRERADDFDEGLRCSLDGKQADMWTAMPGIIQSFNAALQTASVQVAIQAKIIDKTGKLTNVTITLLTDCPCQFPAGGGFSQTWPVAKGDECLVVFGSRCIDAWWEQGGVQPPAEYRMHDLSDGFVLLGFRSKPRALSGVSTTTAQWRSDDGMLYIELAGGHVANIVAPGGVNINGVMIDSAGNINSPATITAAVDVVSDGKSGKGHTHDVANVQSGTSTIATTAPL